MNRLQANICLLCVTLIWSTEAIILACIPDSVIPFAVMCTTNLIGAALLFICFRRWIIHEILSAGKRVIRRCAFLAVLYFIYNAMYMYGLKGFDALTGAFTYSITAAAVPVVMILLHRKASVKMFVSAAMITAGIIISIMNNEGVVQPESVITVIAAAFVRALFFIKLNDTAKEYDSIVLSALIMLFSGMAGFAAWTVVQPATFLAVHWSGEVVSGLFIHGYFISMTAQTLNIFAQRRTTAASATVIYSLETVFATIMCLLLPAGIAGEVTMSAARLIAAGAVVAGNLVDLIRSPEENVAEVQGPENTSSDEQNLDPALRARYGAAEQAYPPEPGLKISKTAGRVRILALSLEPAQKIHFLLILFAAYFVIAVPFRALDIMPGFTDVRPVTVLQPIYGIFFGIPGCFVLGVGNLISDIIAGSLRMSSAAGFAANIIGPLCFHIYWARMSKTEFDLRSFSTIFRHIAVIIFVAVLEIIIIAPAIMYFYPDVDHIKFALIVFINNTVFQTAFGIPLIILVQEELGLEPIPALHRL